MWVVVWWPLFHNIYSTLLHCLDTVLVLLSKKIIVRNDDSLPSALTCEINMRLLHHNIFFFCIDFPFISANYITTVFTLFFIVLWNFSHTLISVTKIRAVIHFENIFFNPSDY